MALPKLQRGPPGALKAYPPPETVDLEKHEFVKLQRGVLQIPDVKLKWEKSKAYHDLLGFIMVLNDAIRGKKLTAEYTVSDNVNNLCNCLDMMDSWIDEIPPIDQPQRFGNKAFRDWFDRLRERSEGLLRDMMDKKYPDTAVTEIAEYLVESVGNRVRIDYGTGHEMAFVFFLCCFYKVGYLTQDDYVATVFKIFNRYIGLMRKLQLAYNMEPAGSHGVWSLDDFQFIPFIWGSGQLLDQAIIEPSSIPEKDRADQYSNDYMFFQCIKYIFHVKTGPFAEHSNTLWGISAVPYWTKVNQGLIKKYKAEVLSAFPVIQHVLFGSLMSIAPIQPGT